MPDGPTKMTDHFSMIQFERALAGFKPPDEPFDAADVYTNRYTMFMCIGGAQPTGTLKVERQPLGEGRARLLVSHQKVAVGGSLHARAILECSTDELATPLNWTLETVAHDVEGKPIEDTRLAESGTRTPGGLEVKSAGPVRRMSVDGPFTFTWALFDAVQRLDAEAAERRFTLIDHLNYQVKPGHRLAFRKSAQVELGGTKVWREVRQDLEAGTVYRPTPAREGTTLAQMHAFEQSGQGILPTVYWRDESGRLLLVLSGLICYVFDPKAEV